jgi:4-amino-4-deoxy-L-arabinose transferase-like glycosyltransferase
MSFFPVFPRREWGAFFLALALAVPISAFSLFRHDLWRPAEAREAGIACDMLESGNYAATTLNFELFLEKPPLYTWAIALPIRVFGRHAWAVRIPVLLFTLGTLALAYPLARRYTGRRGAVAAVAMLSTMALFIEVNHGAMIDNGMLFFIVLAMLAFLRMDAFPPGAGGWRFAGWAALFYGAVGATFLCKGAIGVLLVAGAAGGHCLCTRRWAPLRPAALAAAAVALPATAGSWLWALWARGGAEYYRVFFVENHLHRLLGSYGPTAPWHYYLPLVLAAPLPWTPLLAGGAVLAVRESRAPAGTAGEGQTPRQRWLFLAWWTGWMLFLLSASAGKDNQYILPLLPPLAVLCGAWTEKWLSGAAVARWERVLASIPVLFWSLALPVVPWVPAVAHRAFSWSALAWELALAALSWAALRAFFRHRRAEAAAWTALQLVAFGCATGVFLEGVLDEAKSTRELAEIVREATRGGTLYASALNENTEGALIFHGVRPRRVPDEAEARRIGTSPEPAYMFGAGNRWGRLFSGHLLEQGCWRPVFERDVNGHPYWLLANDAVPPAGDP